MDGKAFSYATSKKDGNVKTIYISDINKDLYETNYRGYLFCPNPKCNARLKFVSRKNGAVSMFQSISIDEHIKECPFKFEYVKYDSDSKVRKNFSEEHIINSIRRQLSKFGIYNISTIKSPSPIAPKAKKRQDEPPIMFYNCNDVYDNLVGRAINVGGFVHSVKINEEENPEKIHAYINFHMPDDRRVNVRISNNIYKRNADTRAIVAQIKQSWYNKPDGMYLLCMCFGYVKKAANGIDIVPAYSTSIGTAYKKI